MLDKLGKRKFVLPIGIMLVLGIMFSLMFYPMANMQVKNLPFAILCLDEGVDTEEGYVNLGPLVADKLIEATEDSCSSNSSTSASASDSSSDAANTTNNSSSITSDSPISWVRVSSQEELDRGLANNEYFGALVIPRDFSKAQYDAIVETMQTQIDEMSSNMTDSLGLSSSGGMDLSALGGAANSATPALSADAQKMIAAAKAAVAGATTQAQSAAANFQQNQAAAAAANQALAQAQTSADELESAIADSRSQLAQLESELASLKNEPAPTQDQLDRIAALETQINDLTSQISTSESQLATAKTQLDSLSAAAEKAQQNATAAQGNLTIAQTNAKSAAMSAAGIQQTAIAGSTLSAKATALMGAVSTIKDKLGNLDISEKLSDMSDTIAAKALMTAADKLRDGDTEDSTENEDADADSNAGKIVVYLDMAKSPMIANTMKSNMQLMFAEVGFSAEILTIHDGTAEGATPQTALAAANADSDTTESADASSTSDDSTSEEENSSPLASVFSLQMLLIPTGMLTMIIGLILTRIVNLRESANKKERAKQLVKQIVLSLVFSGLIALTADAMYAVVVGDDLNYGTITLFIWLVSFCLMLLMSGLANVALPLGVLALLCALGFGNMTGVLPVEALPTFWQDWVWPWAPQRFIGEGIRNIMYMGAGWWNPQSSMFLWVALVGVILSALAIHIPNRKKS